MPRAPRSACFDASSPGGSSAGVITQLTRSACFPPEQRQEGRAVLSAAGAGWAGGAVALAAAAVREPPDVELNKELWGPPTHAKHAPRAKNAPAFEGCFFNHPLQVLQ